MSGAITRVIPHEEETSDYADINYLKHMLSFCCTCSTFLPSFLLALVVGSERIAQARIEKAPYDTKHPRPYGGW